MPRALLDVRKRPEAYEDLLQIWNYTYEHWGEEQADRYLDEIAAAVERICRNPFIGMDCEEIRGGYRRMAVRRHRIYYLIDGDSIEVVRVLHARMDANSRLKG